MRESNILNEDSEKLNSKADSIFNTWSRDKRPEIQAKKENSTRRSYWAYVLDTGIQNIDRHKKFFFNKSHII